MASMWAVTGIDRDHRRRTVPLFRGGSDPELSLREVFLLLAARRRRILLYRLANRDGAVPIADLVTAVVEGETGTAGGRRDAVDRPDSSAIEPELRERHLPKLAETGVVEWDSGDDAVEYRGHPLLERWLRETEYLD